MAICAVVDNPDLSADQFDDVIGHLRASGPLPPEGGSFTVAGPANGGWRVISIWDSHESLEQFFTNRLAHAYREAGVSYENLTRSTFEVHTYFAGDLGSVVAAV